jgi:hypothetical protein
MNTIQNTLISYLFLSYLIFIAACVQIVAPLTLAGALVLSVAMFFVLRRMIPINPADAFFARNELRILWLLLLTLLVVYCHVLLIPPYVRDDMIYHLLVPKQIFTSGGFKLDAYNINANFPMTFELPLTLIFAAHNAISPFVLNLAVLMGLGAAYYFVARQLFNVNRLLALLAIFLFVTTPVVYDLVHSCYVELFMSLLVLITFYNYFRFTSQRNQVRYWYSAMLFAGFICAIKYFGLFYVVFILGIEFFATRNRRQFYMGAVIAAAVCLPWYIKNWILMGNPFYPMFNFLFQSEYISVDRAIIYKHLFADYHAGRQWWDYLLLPLRLLIGFDPPAKPGMMGFGGKLSLFFLSAIIALKYLFQKKNSRFTVEKNRIICILFITYSIFWAISSQQVRFLLPVLTLASLPGLSIISDHWRRAKYVALVLGVLICVQNSVNIGNSMTADKIDELLSGRISRAQFLGYHMPISFDVANDLNSLLNPQTDRIFAIGTFGRNYYFTIPVITNTYYETEPLVRAFQKEQVQPQLLENFFKNERITHLLISHSYLQKSLKGNKSISFKALEDYFKRLTPILSQNGATVYKLNP